MFSPRCSSSGSYSTAVPIEPFSPLSELEEISMETVYRKVLEYQQHLPVRSWVGKRLYDYTHAALIDEKDRVEIARQVWQSLIRLEGLYTDLTYKRLLPEAAGTQNSARLFRAKQCWAYCDKIIKHSAHDVALKNPVLARSKLVTKETLFKMTLIESMSVSLTSRYRKWKHLVEMIDDLIATLPNDSV